MQTTIVIPTYNEAENLPILVSQIYGLGLPGLGMLVVDDDSPDGTGQVADQLAEQYPGRVQVIHRQGRSGFGKAYITGFQAALASGAQIIGQMDADLSHPPELLPDLIERLKSVDVVMGSRYTATGGVDRNWPLWRKGLSAFGNFYARTILGLPVRDVTGGYRIWRRAVLETLPLDRVRSNGYAFLVELTYLAHQLGYSFAEVPFYFSDRKFGQSKMSFKIQREAAIRVWQMKYEYRDLGRKR